MNRGRENAAAAMFEGDDQDWFVTGGRNDEFYFSSTERFNVQDNDFSGSASLPSPKAFHTLVSVNNSHMFLLGGYEITTEVKVFDR